MFFHRCSYKNSCFNELACNYSVLVQILTISSLKFKKYIFLQNFAWDFALLVLKLYPMQVAISVLLWIKLAMGQLLLFFSTKFHQFLQLMLEVSYEPKFFHSLLLIDWYILAIQQIITQEEHLQYTLDRQRSSELPQTPWCHDHNNSR